jgi:hypothetical protein
VVVLRGGFPYCPPYARELAVESAVSQTVLLQTALESGRQVYINWVVAVAAVTVTE